MTRYHSTDADSSAPESGEGLRREAPPQPFFGSDPLRCRLGFYLVGTVMPFSAKYLAAPA